MVLVQYTLRRHGKYEAKKTTVILNGFLVSEKSASSIVQPSSVVDVPVSLITGFLEFPHFVHALRKVT